MNVKVLLEGLDSGRAPYGLDAADELTVARTILTVGRSLPLNPLPPTLTALRPSSLQYEVHTCSSSPGGTASLFVVLVRHFTHALPYTQPVVPPICEDGDPGILSLESSWWGGQARGSQLDSPRHLEAASCRLGTERARL